jgi:hypothetical protein
MDGREWSIEFMPVPPRRKDQANIEPVRASTIGSEPVGIVATPRQYQPIASSACIGRTGEMRLQIRIPEEALTITAAAFGGTGIFLLVLSVFHGFQLAFYGLLMIGCATIIVCSVPRRG